MPHFNVPANIRIEADSAEEAQALVQNFLDYASDVGNDDGAVQMASVGPLNTVAAVAVEG